jgi:hypothetical protein
MVARSAAGPPGLPEWPFVTRHAFRPSCFCMESTGINFSFESDCPEAVVRPTIQYECGKITDAIPSNKLQEARTRSHTEIASMDSALISFDDHGDSDTTAWRRPPRNDPRGDSTIFVPNSERSPQGVPRVCPVRRRIVHLLLRSRSVCRAYYLGNSRWDHPVAYLNSGSILSPSLVPPGSITVLSANFSVS